MASLAIGIGANTAIFSVVNALLLKPLPYPDPDRLAILWLRSPGHQHSRRTGRRRASTSTSRPRTGRSRRCRSRRDGAARCSGFDQPERVEALRTSSSLFHLLGATPLYGRLLLPEDDVPGKAPVVILSHGFWKRLFNADPGVVGRSITLNGVVAGAGDGQEPVHGRRRAAAATSC